MPKHNSSLEPESGRITNKTTKRPTKILHNSCFPLVCLSKAVLARKELAVELSLLFPFFILAFFYRMYRQINCVILTNIKTSPVQTALL